MKLQRTRVDVGDSANGASLSRSTTSNPEKDVVFGISVAWLAVLFWAAMPLLALAALLLSRLLSNA